MTEKNLVESAAELAHKQTGPQMVKTGDGREFLIFPPHFQQHEIKDEYGLKRTPPAYLSQKLTLQAVDSLVEYVNRFKIDDTLLLADIEDSRIDGILDYHSKSSGPNEAPAIAPRAQRAEHIASMNLPFSEEYKAWTAIDGILMKQLDFARFLEENAAEIKAPSGADLLEIVRDIQALRRVNFIQAVRTASDAENFEYKVESEATTKKDGLELPNKFQLSLPIYFGEAPSELFAFLRWNIEENGLLKLGIKLHRLELVRQAVFKQIVLAVGDRTSCPVVFGFTGAH